MKHLILTILCAFLLCTPAFAQRERRTDPVGDNMIPPELLVRNQQELGLTQDQLQSIRDEMQAMQERFPELQKTLQSEMEALGKMLGEEKLNNEKVLDQLDKVLDAERAIKRAQLALALEIRSKLTPDQLAKVKDLKQKMMEEAKNRKPMPDSLRDKMQQLSQAHAQARQDGRDLSGLQAQMQQFQNLVQAQKYQEAEVVLDEMLKSMGK